MDTAEEGTFELIVTNEQGRTQSIQCTPSAVYTLDLLKHTISQNDLTLADEFNLGYEHPEYGAYIMV